MSDVVKVTCPGCQKNLNIPIAWADKRIKCKHCGHQMMAKQKQAAPKIAAKAPAAVPMAMEVPMATAAPNWEPLPQEASPLPAPGPIVTAGGRYAGRGKKYKGPRSGKWAKLAIFGVLFLGLAGGAWGVANYFPNILKLGGESTEPAASQQEVVQTKHHEPSVATGSFPRRLMAISIHDYMYANPLSTGESSMEEDAGKYGTDASIRSLAERWRVPKEQFYHLTDAAQRVAKDKPKERAKSLPIKSVLEQGVTDFFNSSREQDRVVFLFCGHAIEKEGQGYLVPLDGDLEDLTSLVPLKWFYEQVDQCKAQEKLIFFDVCRFHPERGAERPHGGPMTEGLEKVLHDSPAGTTVVTSCSKGEQSFELDYFHSGSLGADIRGSFFLSLIPVASIKGALAPEKKLPAAADELPVDRMTAWVGEKLSELVKDRFDDQKQTLKVTRKHADKTVAYDPNQPLPERFAFTMPPTVDPKLVASIFKEVELPPVKAFRNADAEESRYSGIIPFEKDSLKPYLTGALTSAKSDDPFQKAVLTAVEEMRKMREAGSGTDLMEEFGGETSDAAKNELRKIQEVPAKVEAILQEQLMALEEVAPMKEKQPMRWQAHYDYILAQVKLRICYVNQYNQALALVRGGKVPDLSKDQNGYRLTAEMSLDKNTSKQYKTWYEEAKKSLGELIKEHPNTPWAMMAKSAKSVAIGLRLTPTTLNR